MSDDEQIFFPLALQGIGHSRMDFSEESLMREALKEAHLALTASEVPVGCVFVGSDAAGEKRILCRGANKTNESRNGTQHAEMVAITDALSRGEPASTFVGSDLYVTCEPCIMCAAALAKMGVKRVVFGCHNDRFGGNGSILSVHSDALLCGGAPYEVKSGVLLEEAVAVFQQFYTTENRRGK